MIAILRFYLGLIGCFVLFSAGLRVCLLVWLWYFVVLTCVIILCLFVLVFGCW